MPVPCADVGRRGAAREQHETLDRHGAARREHERDGAVERVGWPFGCCRERRRATVSHQGTEDLHRDAQCSPPHAAGACQTPAYIASIRLACTLKKCDGRFGCQYLG